MSQVKRRKSIIEQKMNRKAQIWITSIAAGCVIGWAAWFEICDNRHSMCDLNALSYEMGALVAANVPVKAPESECRTSVKPQNKYIRQGNTQEIQSPCVALPP